MELLFLKEINPVVESKRLIAGHQFCFRKKHGAVEQIHRVVDIIYTAFDEKSTAQGFFLTLIQHDGLLYKAKKILPESSFPFSKFIHKKTILFRQAERV